MPRPALDYDRLNDDQLRAEVARIIRAAGGFMSARQLSRHTWRFRNVCKALLQTMVDRGMGVWLDCEPGPKGGRPSKLFVLHDGIGETAGTVETGLNGNGTAHRTGTNSIDETR